MHSIFIASGPAFKRHQVVNSFQNIHIYDLIAHILEISPSENDGSIDSISVILR
jgi:hypothetical protein